MLPNIKFTPPLTCVTVWLGIAHFFDNLGRIRSLWAEGDPSVGGTSDGTGTRVDFLSLNPRPKNAKPVVAEMCV